MLDIIIICISRTIISQYFVLIGQTLDLTVSFDKESYTVSESEEYVEVCFSTNMGHDQEVEVIIVPVETPDVSNPAYSNKLTFYTSYIFLILS